jgi:hypothetical protein
MARDLRDKEERLLLALRELETTNELFDEALLAQKTGYKLTTIRTYFSKKLDGFLVSRANDDKWRVSGAITCTDEMFAQRMSQRGSEPQIQLLLGDETEWRQTVQRLLHLGHDRGYRLTEEEAELAMDML